MKKIILSAILFTILFTSCTENKNASLIVGKWQAIQWLVAGKVSTNNAAATSFTFDDKAAYTFNYDGTIEKGTYKVDNNSLYTTAEKQQEIMVNITKLTTDSLTFEMNRGGQAETLILVKAK
jgi:Lipocalin-like domain